jgi:hypothetical protein
MVVALTEAENVVPAAFEAATSNVYVTASLSPVIESPVLLLPRVKIRFHLPLINSLTT